MGLLATLGGLAGNYFFPGVGGAIGSALGGSLEEESGGGASGAARDAAGAANAAAERDLALRTRMYEESIARQQPYADVGLEFTNKLAAMQRGGPGANASMLSMDPGYAFRFSEGQKALDRQSAARGGLISGGALKAATRFGQEMGSQEFGNAYDRMAKLAALGPSAAGVQNNLGTTYAAGAGPQMYQQGVNTGNALLAGYQARESTYGNLGSALSKYLSKGYNADTTGGGTGIVGYGRYDGAVQGGEYGSA